MSCKIIHKILEISYNFINNNIKLTQSLLHSYLLLEIVKNTMQQLTYTVVQSLLHKLPAERTMNIYTISRELCDGICMVYHKDGQTIIVNQRCIFISLCQLNPNKYYSVICEKCFSQVYDFTFFDNKTYVFQVPISLSLSLKINRLHTCEYFPSTISFCLLRNQSGILYCLGFAMIVTIFSTWKHFWHH